MKSIYIYIAIAIIILGGAWFFLAQENTAEEALPTAESLRMPAPGSEDSPEMIVEEEAESLQPTEGEPALDLPEVTEEEDEATIACAQDVRICPDGSAVSRVAPSCEFATCPNTELVSVIEDPAPQTHVFAIGGTNFAFDMEEIRVAQGDTVTINFTSVDGFHDWVVDEFDAATERVNSGGKTSVTFVADKTGSFEYYCSVGTHREKGMVGTLIVE